MERSDKVCTSKPVWPQSCKVMLESKYVNFIVVVEFVLIILFNNFSLFLQAQGYKFSCQKKMNVSSFGITVSFLNFNDLFFGLYLIVMFIVNDYYGRSYVVHVAEWLGSIYCKSLGFISLFSMLNSLFILNFMSVSRLVVVICPFNSYIKTNRTVIRYVIIGMFTITVVCMITVMIYGITEQNKLMPSSTCLFLGETSKSLTVKMITILISSIQIGSFLNILIIYIIIINELNKPNITNFKSSRIDKQILVQSVLITITNALCWLPSSAIYITSVVMETYPTNLLIWNAILINPLNSVINPLIFCLGPLLKRYVSKKS